MELEKLANELVEAACRDNRLLAGTENHNVRIPNPQHTVKKQIEIIRQGFWMCVYARVHMSIDM